MEKMIFINLPVTDLARSIAFYEAVGGTADPVFRDETVQMMRLSDTICVMLMTHARLRDFTDHEIADPRRQVLSILTLSEESRAAVDATVEKAVAAGGAPDPSPIDDHGWMYGRGFTDPDGHMWGLCWMDVEAATAVGAASQAQPA